jgi:mevalonate kinase
MTAAARVGVAVLAAATASRADPPAPVFKDCTQPSFRILDQKGTAFTMSCDWVMVLTLSKAQQLFGEREQMQQTMELLQRRGVLTAQALDLSAQMRQEFEALQKDEDKRYAELKAAADRAVKLGEESTAKTDEAIALARKRRYASYVSSGLVGAAAGGLGVYLDTHSAGPTVAGALVGAAAGVLIDYLVIKLVAP